MKKSRQEKKKRLKHSPEPKCVRKNHNLLAVHYESRVAEEVLKSNFFIMPDGTSWQGVGEIVGSVVKVGDGIRTLKAV